MAATVLACILKELGLLGMLFSEWAMAVAAVKDVFAWALPALALSVSSGGSKRTPLAPAVHDCIEPAPMVPSHNHMPLQPSVGATAARRPGQSPSSVLDRGGHRSDRPPQSSTVGKRTAKPTTTSELAGMVPRALVSA